MPSSFSSRTFRFEESVRAVLPSHMSVDDRLMLELILFPTEDDFLAADRAPMAAAAAVEEVFCNCSGNDVTLSLGDITTECRRLCMPFLYRSPQGRTVLSFTRICQFEKRDSLKRFLSEKLKKSKASATSPAPRGANARRPQDEAGPGGRRRRRCRLRPKQLLGRPCNSSSSEDWREVEEELRNLI